MQKQCMIWTLKKPKAKVYYHADGTRNEQEYLMHI